MPECPLCAADGGELVWRGDALRVVLVDEHDYPGFVRVIWNAHVAEMTDLAVPDRSRLMAAVCKVEGVVRGVLRPDKINLASLGNVVPHLHWHVIPRWRDDLHFPGAVWAARDPAREPAAAARRAAVAAHVPELRAALALALAAG